MKLLSNRCTLVEVFCSSASSLSFEEERRGGCALRIGLETGQDLRKVQDQRYLKLLLRIVRPLHVHVAWPCGPWGNYSRVNAACSEGQRRHVAAQRAEGRCFLKVAGDCWDIQTQGK